MTISLIEIAAVTGGGLDEAGRLVLRVTTKTGESATIPVSDDAACDLMHILPLAVAQRLAEAHLTAASRVVGSA